jgi:predicted Zn-dependent peptidase
MSATNVAQNIHVRKLDCGMTVLVQTMPWLRTAAFSLAIPAGLVEEPGNRLGLAAMVAEMVQRGAGPYSSRDLVAVQDNLGMDRSGGVSTAMASFGAAMPAESIEDSLRIYAEVVRRPHLPTDQLDDARAMGLQELRAIEDEPTHRVMRRLRQLHYGDVLGRTVFGTEDGLDAITNDDIRSFFQRHYHGGGSILGIAGNVEPTAMFGLAEELFGDWATHKVAPLVTPSGSPGYESIEFASSQTHIGFSFPTVPYGHPDYFTMRAGVGILSDGMSSRLFDRVREKRGLCYTVSASCHSLPHAGGVFGYAGTTPARAQETLDVTLREIEHLADDLTVDELDRWKVRIESGLVMEQESSASRASSLVSDQRQIGRPQSTDELQSMIESLTLESVRDYWINHPPQDYRIVTLGPERLSVESV